MLKKIKIWLEDSKRDYRQGLEMFRQLATDTQKVNFLAFFEKVKEDESVDQFDIRFTTLVNQMLFIQNRVKANPEAFAEAAKIVPLAPNSKIENTKSQIALDDLPEEFDVQRQRLKELVPLMAKLHADMAVETLADDKRLEIVKQLVALDDERLAIWDQINAYANGENLEVSVSDEETEVEKKSIALGADIAKRIEQLKENIANNEKKIIQHEKNGKKTYADKARASVEAYKAELTNLEAAIAK